ncbi:hypothetical protein H4CHR_00276 [Variovorax sp. PBS-H4]|nr:hypothetical protein H4CHR_00276 [Variovorax sp. PBS-H4]
MEFDTEIRVTMENIAKVFEQAEGAIGSNSRAVNILYCAAGGNNGIIRSDWYPETHTFTTFLTDLPEGMRQEYVEALFNQLKQHIPENSRYNINRLIQSGDIHDLLDQLGRYLGIHQ